MATASGRVAAHPDGRAEFGQCGRLLEDLGRDAAFPKREPERQSADARPDDGNPQFVHRHASNVGVEWVLVVDPREERVVEMVDLRPLDRQELRWIPCIA